MSDFWFYFNIGLQHVLDWSAYDHVLFLMVLAVPYSFDNWKQILWLVTVFTIGHTISLVVAAFEFFTPESSKIEFFIPMTILVGAIYNVFLAGKKSDESNFGMLLVFALFFGLIHGLGFSTFFVKLTAHLDSRTVPLVSFASGIELSQIIIIMAVLILGFIMQRMFRVSRKDWILVVSSIVIGLVIPMLKENYPF